MKKLFIIVTLLLFSLNIFAQQNQQTSVDLNKLSPAARAEIEKIKKTESISENLKTVSEWSGMGKEIGQAVRDGLMAVVDASEKFGKTEVGYFTMALIGFSIIGKPIMFIAVWLIMLGIFVFMYRYMTKPIRVIKTKEGSIFTANRKITYEYKDPPVGDDTKAGIAGILLLLAFTIFTIATMFNIG